MIELVDDVPSGVFGLRAGGLVTPEEYSEVVRPALSDWLEREDTLRVLAIIHRDFSYADGDWVGASEGVLRRPEWQRLGVMTDSTWLRRIAPFVSVFVPARTRTFGMDQVRDAHAWVTG